jgi:hypothetical protein
VDGRACFSCHATEVDNSFDSLRKLLHSTVFTQLSPPPLNRYVRGVVNSGFSGLIWAPEMRQATCDEDFARRTQLMFLAPQAQYNAWATPTPGKGEPWYCNANDTAWMAMFKKHHDLRTGLASYLYAGFEAQGRTGLPLARPLLLDSPDDVRHLTLFSPLSTLYSFHSLLSTLFSLISPLVSLSSLHSLLSTRFTQTTHFTHSPRSNILFTHLTLCSLYSLYSLCA